MNPDESPLFPRIEQDSSDPDVVEAYAKAHDLFGHVSELFSVLANAPTALSGWIDLLRRLRRQLSVEPALGELGIVVVASMHGNQRVMESHIRLAAADGVSEQELRAAAAGAVGELGERGRLARELAVQIVGGGADELLVRRCQQEFGVRETAELIILYSFYCMVCRVNASMDVYVSPKSS